MTLHLQSPLVLQSLPKRKGFFRRGVTPQGAFLSRLFRGRTTKAERRREAFQLARGVGIVGTALSPLGIAAKAGLITGGLLASGVFERSARARGAAKGAVKSFDPSGLGQSIGLAIEGKGKAPTLKEGLKKAGIIGVLGAAAVGAAKFGPGAVARFRGREKPLEQADIGKAQLPQETKIDTPLTTIPSVPTAPVKAISGAAPNFSNVISIQNVLN